MNGREWNPAYEMVETNNDVAMLYPSLMDANLDFGRANPSAC
jgi:hypothetical protein